MRYEAFWEVPRRGSLREAAYESKQAVNKDAEARRRVPIERDPEVLNYRSSGVIGCWESRVVLSLVSIASAESDTTCVNAFSMSSDKKKTSYNWS